jgi:hypothetical protein
VRGSVVVVKQPAVFPPKVPVVCFAVFPMGVLKRLGGIIDIAFDLTTFENKSH